MDLTSPQPTEKTFAVLAGMEKLAGRNRWRNPKELVGMSNDWFALSC